MQPWLDWNARETGCRRCGRPFHDGDVHIWACRERTRRFDFDGGRTGGEPGLIRYDEVSRAYPVCGSCLRALQGGAPMGRAALARVLAVLGGVAVLWLAGGPAVHRWAPNFVAAFYRNGGVWGR